VSGSSARLSQLKETDDMGIFDKAKEVLGDHTDKVDEGIAKAGDYADERTGNKYSDKIDQTEALAKDHVGDYLADSDPATEPGPDPQPPA
jgi:hypothetical protein